MAEYFISVSETGSELYQIDKRIYIFTSSVNINTIGMVLFMQWRCALH